MLNQMEIQAVECSFCEGAGSNDLLQLVTGVHICEGCVSKEEVPTATATPCTVCRKCQYHVRRPRDRSDLAVCEQCIARVFEEKAMRNDTVPHCSFCLKVTSPGNLIQSSPDSGKAAHICRDCIAKFAGKGA